MKKTLGLFTLLLLASCYKAPQDIAVSPLHSKTESGLHDTARLRKLSLHLRGVLPSENDYQKLASAKNLPEFWNEITREYIASPYYTGKMIDRLDELFRMKTSSGLPESRLFNPEGDPSQLGGAETYNSLDLLFEKIARENLSWDTLITGKTYSSPPAGGDIKFFSLLGEFKPTANPFFQQVEFAPEEKRIAGAVTTSRFINRYSTTNLNRNRGRAAAIFRIFLCDDMKAVVTPTAEEEKELVGNAFPIPEPDFHSTFRNDSLLDDDKHGSQPACMACHYKLDPMGRTFMNIGLLLPTQAAPGKLVYKRHDGTLVDYAGKGLGDVLTFLSTQPEYARCQVQHFWRWFIRGDEMPSPERTEELVAEFDRVGRRTNDFVTYLVNQPEFHQKIDLTSQPATLLQVMPMLQRCDSCHGGLTVTVIPSFARFPIGSEETHASWMANIAEKLDLADDGKARTMPPVQSDWQPSDDELHLFKRWIWEGGKNESGKSTLTEEQSKEMLKGAEAKPILPRMEFRDSYLRYVRTHDLIRLYQQKFPNAFSALPTICQALNDSNRSILGDGNPFNGELSFRSPSLGFIRWLGKCLMPAVIGEMELTLQKDKSFARFLGGKEFPKNALETPRNVAWESLTPAQRTGIIRHSIHQMVGPNIVEETITIGRIEEFLKKKGPKLNCFDAVGHIYFYLGSSDDFLTF